MIMSKKYYMDKITELKANHNLNFEKKYWDGKFTKPLREQYKISICTTCMDRGFDLKKTLPKNIEDNKSYPHLEFVVLDYNGKDKIGKWIKKNMMEHIESGRLAYYRTETPKFYSMTKSRNLAFKVATGEIVNNVDADNYIHKGFANYINAIANQFPEKVIFAKGKQLLRGRLGFWKDDFMNILKGYDEKIEDYGRDDHDLYYRGLMAGFTLACFGGEYFSKTESPSHQTENMKVSDWKLSELRNELYMLEGIAQRRIKGNKGDWGKDTLIKNFKEEIILV